MKGFMLQRNDNPLAIAHKNGVRNMLQRACSILVIDMTSDGRGETDNLPSRLGFPGAPRRAPLKNWCLRTRGDIQTFMYSAERQNEESILSIWVAQAANELVGTYGNEPPDEISLKNFFRCQMLYALTSRSVVLTVDPSDNGVVTNISTYLEAMRDAVRQVNLTRVIRDYGSLAKYVLLVPPLSDIDGCDTDALHRVAAQHGFILTRKFSDIAGCGECAPAYSFVDEKYINKFIDKIGTVVDLREEDDEKHQHEAAAAHVTQCYGQGYRLDSRFWPENLWLHLLDLARQKQVAESKDPLKAVREVAEQLYLAEAAE
jgi:hypothetical protein